MKLIATVMLIAIIAGLSSPISIKPLPGGKDDCPRLVMLDVCGAGHRGVSLNSQAPFLVCTYRQEIAPPLAAPSHVHMRVECPPILVFPKDRPPEA